MHQRQFAVDRLRFSYGDNHAVREVSFSVAEGGIHGLCGHNGAGKSTVVKMLSGQLAPDEGTILVRGEEVHFTDRRSAQRAGVALVDQELSVVPSLTVLENLQLGDGRTGWLNRPRAARRRARELLDEVGLGHLDLGRAVSSLNLGERQLVEIARALGQDATMLILDEPTATLSDVETALVFTAVRRVAAGGCSVVFVSHRLGEVLDLCDAVTVLRDGVVVGTTPVAETTVDQLIEAILGRAPDSTGGGVDPASPAPVGVAHLAIEGLDLGSQVGGFFLGVPRGTIHGLAGQLGSGADDVLRAVAGLDPTARGRIAIGGTRLAAADPVGAVRAGVAFVSGDRKTEGLFLDQTIADNLVATRLPQLSGRVLLRRSTLATSAADVAAHSGLPAHRLQDDVRALSGGNQQKVFVGRCLARSDVSVLLLVEPTRGVDVGGRAAIHELLRSAARAGLVVVFSSTDLDEVVELADVVSTMRDGRVVQTYRGAVDVPTLMHDMTHAEPGAA